jgi:hypothetical protein
MISSAGSAHLGVPSEYVRQAGFHCYVVSGMAATMRRFPTSFDLTIDLESLHRDLRDRRGRGKRLLRCGSVLPWPGFEANRLPSPMLADKTFFAGGRSTKRRSDCSREQQQRTFCFVEFLVRRAPPRHPEAKLALFLFAVTADQPLAIDGW